jgi:hypothetical protein
MVERLTTNNNDQTQGTKTMAKNMNATANETSATNEVKVEAQTDEQKKAAQTATLNELLAKHKTVSGVIRALAAEGKKTGDIAKLIGKRYQHVRNVLKQPLKKAA